MQDLGEGGHWSPRPHLTRAWEFWNDSFKWRITELGVIH